jgi:hypothetical protein
MTATTTTIHRTLLRATPYLVDMSGSPELTGSAFEGEPSPGPHPGLVLTAKVECSASEDIARPSGAVDQPVVSDP